MSADQESRTTTETDARQYEDDDGNPTKFNKRSEIMSGYNTILRVRDLEAAADRLGFRIGLPKHGNYRQEFGDIAVLYPKDDSLPIYSRDAELFAGTLEEIEVWLTGWEKSHVYYRMLIGKNFEKQVARKEQDYLNQDLIKLRLKRIKGAVMNYLLKYLL